MSLTDRASQAVEELAQLQTAGHVIHQVRTGRLSRNPNFAAKPEEDRWLYERVWQTLKHAEPFWWELPIVNLVAVAANSLGRWTVRPELFPTVSGFALFARPMPSAPDGLHTQRALAGFSWIVDADRDVGRVRLSYLTRIDSALDAFSIMDVKFGDEVTRQMGTSYWDAATHQPSGTGPDLESVATAQVGAALLFLEQRIAVASKEQVDRLARKRLDKADIVYPELRVVRLRTSKHQAPSDNDPNPVDWQYRWLVRGHWRQQYYRSDDEHRPLWITPYVKGPEDKPLKAPNKSVFAVVR